MTLQSAFLMESRVADIMSRQAQRGVAFDMQRAKYYVHELEVYKIQRWQKVKHLFKPVRYAPPQPFVAGKKLFTRAGKVTKHVADWLGDQVQYIEPLACFSKVGFEEPVLSKRGVIADQLIALGWKPENYTDAGNPRLVVDGEPCPSLRHIESDLGQHLAMWYVYNHRQSQITGLISRVRDDGRIEADAYTIGTPTYRMRHRGVVNIPKASKNVTFGRQMRSIFKATEGYKLVGHDASGLELRTLAHYIDDPEFTKQILEGDIHTKNQIDAGLSTRDQAKTFIYAFVYGAGDAKIGMIVGGSSRDGRVLRERFLSANPKLERLIRGVRSASKRGYLVGIDGRRIKMRTDPVTGKILEHKALNLLNQGCGAIVMKMSMCLLDEWVKEFQLDAHKVIDMHDEAQWEVRGIDVELFRILAEDSIREAGKQLGLRCPLDAESKVGRRWCDTH